MTKKCKSYACLLSKEHVYTRSYEGGGYPILHSLKLTPQSIRRDCLILCPPPLFRKLHKQFINPCNMEVCI